MTDEKGTNGLKYYFNHHKSIKIIQGSNYFHSKQCLSQIFLKRRTFPEYLILSTL